MADVIFNGTDGRKPLGMAEVSLTIGGVDEEHLRAAGVEIAYNEVTVTRRVFRDGGSEYFINKTPCRLQGHPAVLHGHWGGPDQLQHHGPGEHHPDSLQQTGGSAPDFRGGRRHHQVQSPEDRSRCASSNTPSRTCCACADLVREVKRQIGSLAAPGRQGAPLQTALPGAAAPRYPVGAAPIRRAPGRNPASAKPPPKRFATEIEIQLRRGPPLRKTKSANCGCACPNSSTRWRPCTSADWS